MEKPVEFHDGLRRYHADSCLPLVDAVRRNELRLHAWVHGHYPGRPLPETVLPQLLSVGYWSAERDQEWFLPCHRNEGVEITFVENGSLPFFVEEREYNLEPNTLTITRPWQAHQVGSSGMPANRLLWIIVDVGVRRPNQEWKWPDWILIDNPLLQELTSFIRKNETPVWFAARRMRNCFDEIARAVENPTAEPMTYNLLKIRINEVLLTLLGYYRTRNPVLSDSCTSNMRAVELFLKQLGEEDLTFPWTLDEMARRCGVGTTSLTAHCKELTNLTPLRYLKKLRIHQAELILQSENADPPIIDVALACGFSSSQYFAVEFRKETGLTPTEYRAKRRLP